MFLLLEVVKGVEIGVDISVGVLNVLLMELGPRFRKILELLTSSRFVWSDIIEYEMR